MGKEQVSSTVFYYTVAFSIKQYQTLGQYFLYVDYTLSIKIKVG